MNMISCFAKNQSSFYRYSLLACMLMASIFMTTSLHASTIAAWEMFSLDNQGGRPGPDVAEWAACDLHENIDSAVVARGAGLTGASGFRNTFSWQNSHQNTLAAAINNGNYVSITLTAKPGRHISVDRLQFWISAAGLANGREFALLSDATGFTVDDVLWSAVPTQTKALYNVDLVTAELRELSSIEFRLYSFGSSSQWDPTGFGIDTLPKFGMAGDFHILVFGDTGGGDPKSVDITNLKAVAREGTRIVDVTYDVHSELTDTVKVTLKAFVGLTEIPVTDISGDFGKGVDTGTNRMITWQVDTDFQGDLNDLFFSLRAENDIQPNLLKTGDDYPFFGPYTDGGLQIGMEPIEPRFITETNGTHVVVKDMMTGLMWVQNPDELPGNEALMTWEEAIDFCNDFDYAGFDDWRLPNYYELLTLYLQSQARARTPYIYPVFNIGSREKYDNFGDDAYFWYYFSSSISPVYPSGQQSTHYNRPLVVSFRNETHRPQGVTWLSRPFPVRTIDDYEPPYQVMKTGITISHRVGDDGYYQYGAEEPEDRFERIVTDRGTIVRDHMTGLEWMYNKFDHPLLRFELFMFGQYGSVSTYLNQLAMSPHLLYANRNGWHGANNNQLNSIGNFRQEGLSQYWYDPDVFWGEEYDYPNKWWQTSTSSLTYSRHHHQKKREQVPYVWRDGLISDGKDTLWFVRVTDWADDIAYTVIQYTLPYVAAEPEDLTLQTGTEGTLSLLAYPSDFTLTLTYQWYFGSAPDTSQPIAGATNATYTIPDTLPAGSYTYFVAVTDALGTTYSRTVTVTVIDDFDPPTTIIDLRIERTTTSTVELRWTAPEDALTEVAGYEIRYHTEPITDANYESAAIFPAPPEPLDPGMEQSVVVRSLDEGTAYYFAVKSRDTVHNVSLLSNVPGTSTLTPLFVAYHSLAYGQAGDPTPHLTSFGWLTEHEPRQWGGDAFDLKSYYHNGMPAWGAQFQTFWFGGGGAAGTAPAFAEGTDHHRLFSGFLGNNALTTHSAVSPHDTPYFRLINLPPGIYDITVSIANQGNGGQDMTVFTLEDAADFVQASSVGTLQWDDGDPATTVLPSDNRLTGYVARWSGITPTGEEGTAFTIRPSAYSSQENHIFMPRWIRLSMVPTQVMIVHQPQGSLIPAGQSASLAVEGYAIEGALTYQWYRGESGDTSEPVDGATSAVFETPVLPDPGTFPFWVRVSDDAGSVDSVAALIEVLPNTTPTPVTDLEIIGHSSTTILLSWTDPEVAEGYAAPHAFDIRVSTHPITEANFDEATPLTNIPAPGVPGTIHQLTAVGLTPGQRHYFAMRTVAEAGVTGFVNHTGLNVRLPLELWTAYHNTIEGVNNPGGSLVSEGSEVDVTYTLKNYNADGAELPVTVTITSPHPADYPPVTTYGSYTLPIAGTDAHALFSGKLDITNRYRFVYFNPSRANRYYVFTFDGLEPGALYDVAMTMNCGHVGAPSDQHLELQEVDAFAPATTVGATAKTIYPETGEYGQLVQISQGNQNAGAVARWTSIVADGNGGTRFSVKADSKASSGQQKYVPQLIRLSKISYDMAFTQPPQHVAVPVGEPVTLTVQAESEYLPITYEWFAGETGLDIDPLGTGPSLTLHNLPLGEHPVWVRATDAMDTVLESDTVLVTVYVPDTIPPDTITDLSASGVLGTSLTLNWTAPDDDDTGVASYEIRYSTEPIIDDASFSAATLIENPPAPAAPGTPQSVPVAGLAQDTLYFFAIKSTDHAGNVSDLSNVLGVHTLGAPTVAGLISDFNTGAPATLPNTWNLASTSAGWHGTPSSGDSGNYVRHLEEGGNGDGYLQLARNWHVGQRQAISIWINPADYGMVPGKTYFLQFDYQVNRTGAAATYRSDAMVRYAVGDNNGTYSQAGSLENSTAATISGDGNIFFNFAATGFSTPGETAWTTHTSQLGFTYTDYGAATRIVIVINGQGFGQNVATFDPLNHFTYLGIDNVRLLVAPEQPAPQPHIMVQPQSVQISAGTTTTLSVLASTSGGALSYQWYQGESGDTSVPVGENSAAFTTPALAESTIYWVAVSDDNGTSQSSSATVTVMSGVADSDGDGIPDWWEDEHFGGPTNADATALAANQVNTLLEAYIAGLDPHDPAVFFTVAAESDAGEGFTLIWDAIPGRLYNVYRALNLMEPDPFVLLESDIADGTFTDTEAGDAPQRYYRIDVRLE